MQQSNPATASRTNARSKSNAQIHIQFQELQINQTTDPGCPIFQAARIRPDPPPQRGPPMRVLRGPVWNTSQCGEPNDTELRRTPTHPNASSQTLRER